MSQQLGFSLGGSAKAGVTEIKRVGEFKLAGSAAKAMPAVRPPPLIALRRRASADCVMTVANQGDRLEAMAALMKQAKVTPASAGEFFFEVDDRLLGGLGVAFDGVEITVGEDG